MQSLTFYENEPNIESSMLHVESTGHLTIDALSLDSSQTNNAVIMVDEGGILQINDITALSMIQDYYENGGLFTSSSVDPLNIFQIDDALYITTLEQSAIPEFSHVSFFVGLFSASFIVTRRRKIS